jgi:hypothetical protein
MTDLSYSITNEFSAHAQSDSYSQPNCRLDSEFMFLER